MSAPPTPRPRRLRVVPALLLLASCAAMASGARPRFLALGDSYTIGEGVAGAGRWPNQLARALRESGVDMEDPQIIARTGWTTGELDAAIDAAAPRGPFRLVTLLIGVNNQYRGRDAEEFRRELAGLLRRAVGFAGGAPARVVVVSIPDWGVTPFARGRDRSAIAAAIDRYNTVVREEAARAGARHVDVTAISRRGDASLLAEDGLHPSAAQYAEWTRALLPAATAALR